MSQHVELMGMRACKNSLDFEFPKPCLHRARESWGGKRGLTWRLQRRYLALRGITGAGELGEEGRGEEEGMDLQKRGEEINTRSEREGGGGRGVAICDRRAAIKSPLPYFPRNKCWTLPTSLLPLTLKLALLWPKLGLAKSRKIEPCPRSVYV